MEHYTAVALNLFDCMPFPVVFNSLLTSIYFRAYHKCILIILKNAHRVIKLYSKTVGILVLQKQKLNKNKKYLDFLLFCLILNQLNWLWTTAI